MSPFTNIAWSTAYAQPIRLLMTVGSKRHLQVA